MALASIEEKLIEDAKESFFHAELIMPLQKNEIEVFQELRSKIISIYRTYVSCKGTKSNSEVVKEIHNKIVELDKTSVPPSVADNFIILKPRSEWPNPNKPKAQFIEELAAGVEPMPGNRYEFLQPIQMRFNELLSGVRAELAIKVFGDDFDTLATLGKSINTAIINVEGTADIQVERTTGLPIMTINPKLAQLTKYGISVKQLQDQLSTVLGGSVAGKFYKVTNVQT
ncbi:MAG: Cu/Ag efflux pump CusA [Colwellia sp.]|jgi:Cu/Ag efflux pump CusA